jgi:hypothetical protein
MTPALGDSCGIRMAAGRARMPQAAGDLPGSGHCTGQGSRSTLCCEPHDHAGDSMSEIVCDACKLPPPAGAALGDTGLATGWVIRRIDGRSFTLCDCCGSIRHFKGGISAYLQRHLGVNEYAEVDFGDAPGSGLHRHRVRRPG